MFKFKKSITIIPALLALGIGVVFAWARRTPLVEENPPIEVPSEVRGVAEEAIIADLVLDFGEEKIATYSGIHVEEETVLGILLKAASDQGFEVDFTPPSGEMGAFVKSIGGVENTKEKFWQFWVNNEYGQVAMDQQEIKGGDVIEIKFRGFE